MARFDAIFVGSGINALVGAGLLARQGWRVCVLERNSWLGGNIRTAEITLPGYRHDVLSGWHPLFVGSAGYRELADELAVHGLEYLNTEAPTATLFPDGSAAFLSTSQPENVHEFESFQPGEGRRWEEFVQGFLQKAELAFGLLGTELWSLAGASLVWKGLGAVEPAERHRLGADFLSSARSWLNTTFQSQQLRGLLAPWVLHTGLGPDAAGSGFMTQVIAAALQLGGMPVPRGGGDRLVEAFTRLLESYDATLRKDSDVKRILLRDGCAVGVRLESGEEIYCERAVICSVTPTQLYLRLLGEGAPRQAEIQPLARRYRYGRADMQIHLALSEPPQWPGDDERLLRTALLHVTPGLDGVSKAVNEADRGLLPAEGTIVVGQPLAVDPSRAPAGSWIFWIQLQELPSAPEGDAAEELDCSAGHWTSELAEAYADRIIGRLAALVPNLKSSILKRVILAPPDLERLNINLVGGDPYGGDCSLDQSFLWRPLPGLPHHRTAVADLYHIGASTHPGPGLHGASGYLVARQLLRGKTLGKWLGR